MTDTKIKICGLSRETDIRYANELMPDYIGFVFAPGSRRFVEPDRARELKGSLHPAIKAVGVFVNEEPELIASLARDKIIDMIQLHGNEDDTCIADLRQRTGAPIIKAFRVSSPEDVRRAEESTADYILLDNGSGGTGKAFDWTCLEQVGRPWFLAGGLDPGNVARAVREYRPYGVDVSSGVEKDGYKDYQAMSDFIKTVRRT